MEILGKLEIKKREQTPFQVLLKRLLSSGTQVRDKVPLTKSRGEHQTHFGLHSTMVSVITMAFPVVEFSRQGYKIRKVFGKKSTLFK